MNTSHFLNHQRGEEEEEKCNSLYEKRLHIWFFLLTFLIL